MDPRQKKALIESAVPDGNCAFNAFVLGFSKPEVLDGIEKALKAQNSSPDAAFRDFLSKAAAALDLDDDTWSMLRAGLLNNENRWQLQKELAPVFRELSIEIIERNAALMEGHRDSTLVVLESQFESYLDARFRNPSASDSTVLRQVQQEANDDTYLNHDFIKQKFSQLYSELTQDLTSKAEAAKKKAGSGQMEAMQKFALDYKRAQDELNNAMLALSRAKLEADKISAELRRISAQKALEKRALRWERIKSRLKKKLHKWWEQPKEGYEALLSALKEPAKGAHEVSRYGGEQELGWLGDYFGVKVKVSQGRGDPDIQLNFNYGNFNPKEIAVSQKIAKDLVKADLLQATGSGQFQWKKKMTREELEKRLSPLPFLEELKAPFKACYKVLEGLKTTREKSEKLFDAALLPAAALTDLVSRGVIRLKNGADKLLFSMVMKDEVDALFRMGGIAKEAVRKKIISSWEKNHREPGATMTLQNRGAHWDNVIEPRMNRSQIETKPLEQVSPVVSSPSTQPVPTPTPQSQGKKPAHEDEPVKKSEVQAETALGKDEKTQVQKLRKKVFSSNVVIERELEKAKPREEAGKELTPGQSLYTVKDDNDEFKKDKVIVVSKEQQVKLDEALAKRLDAEEKGLTWNEAEDTHHKPKP
jgi:hypothetical protein